MQIDRLGGFTRRVDGVWMRMRELAIGVGSDRPQKPSPARWKVVHRQDGTWAVGPPKPKVLVLISS